MSGLTSGLIAHRIAGLLCRQGLIIALACYKKIAKAAVAALVFLQMICVVMARALQGI